MKRPVVVNGGKPGILDAAGETIKSQAQQECISLLEQVLANARNGDVHACVVVAVGPGDFGVAIAGSDAPKLYMGCAVAQRTILDRTSPPAGAGRTVLHK